MDHPSSAAEMPTNPEEEKERRVAEIVERLESTTVAIFTELKDEAIGEAEARQRLELLGANTVRDLETILGERRRGPCSDAVANILGSNPNISFDSQGALAKVMSASHQFVREVKWFLYERFANHTNFPVADHFKKISDSAITVFRYKPSIDPNPTRRINFSDLKEKE